MIHLGDITQLHGGEIPVVDIITGGSPCQDLSVAGKRAGLNGERSGLFMEQIRIVKEMRERDRNTGRSGFLIRPRYMVWENVPGAFSSNKGRDFQAVLSETVKITESDAPDVPLPDRGKWSHSGCLYSDMGDWSIAWRVHDAQFWGVPQRRKRIALVADFGGLTAPEILFERKGLSGDFEQGGAPWEGAAGAVGKSIESASWGIDHVITTGGNCTAQGPCVYEEVEAALKACGPHAVFSAISFQEQAGKPGGGKGILIQEERTGALSTLNIQSVLAGEAIHIEGNGQRESHRGNGYGNEGDPMFTLNSTEHHAVAAASEPILLESNQNHATIQTGGISTALPASAGFSFGNSAKARSIGYEDEVSPTLRGGEGGNQKPCVLDSREPLCYGCFQNTGRGWWNQSNVGATLRTPCGGDSVKANIVTSLNSIVRRLTPLECERLQGFPDGWTDIGEWTDSKGRLHKEADSPRYKALGNSIALPFWEYLARRICALYERPATMGSLFDGIGGFPLAFERAGAKAVWASEIEEFPIAVTKLHFPEERSIE